MSKRICGCRGLSTCTHVRMPTREKMRAIAKEIKTQMSESPIQKAMDAVSKDAKAFDKAIGGKPSFVYAEAAVPVSELRKVMREYALVVDTENIRHEINRLIAEAEKGGEGRGGK